jgi:predicted aldo/keto reductase-like oxidoreductase
MDLYGKPQKTNCKQVRIEKLKPLPLHRRDFIKLSAGSMIAVGAAPLFSWAPQVKKKMPERTLGRTGEKVSLLTVGGLHMSWMETENGVVDVAEQEGIKIVRGAIDQGVSFVDNAWSYNNGRSETVMGKALKEGYRDKVLVMTKILARNLDDAKKQLETSLERYQLDRVDLIQFHALGAWEEDVDTIYNGGFLEWADDVRSSGLTKYIGFTGHNDPAVHLDMIKRGFEWDTCQMPINLVDYYNPNLSFERDVLPVANEKNIGVIAMKTNGYGRDWFKPVSTPLEGLRYAMSLPVSTVVSGMTSEAIMKENVNATLNFKPMSKSEMEAYRNRVSGKQINEHYRSKPSPKKK